MVALGQFFVADLGESKLTPDDFEGMPHLGPHTGLELFGLVQQGPHFRRFSVRGVCPGAWPPAKLRPLDSIRKRHPANFKHQAPGGQGGINGGHDLDVQVMFFEQWAKLQDGGFVGQSGDSITSSKRVAAVKLMEEGIDIKTLPMPAALKETLQ